MLELKNISKAFAGPEGQVVVLDDWSLSLESGRFVAMQGPSGSGKTTALLIAGALQRPDRGEVRLDGTNLYDLASDARARLRAGQIGFVFQQYHLVAYLSVLDNVLVPSIACPNDDAEAHARALLDRFGLSHRLGHVPAALSAGECQRTALARAMLNRPRLILADEPTGNLDAESAKVILSALRDFSEAGGMVLLATHDPQAAAAADEVVTMSRSAAPAGASA